MRRAQIGDIVRLEPTHIMAIIWLYYGISIAYNDHFVGVKLFFRCDRIVGNSASAIKLLACLKRPGLAMAAD